MPSNSISTAIRSHADACLIAVLEHLHIFLLIPLIFLRALLFFFSVIGNLNKVKICLNLAKNFCADAGKLMAIEAQIDEIHANAAIVTMHGMFSFFQVGCE